MCVIIRTRGIKERRAEEAEERGNPVKFRYPKKDKTREGRVVVALSVFCHNHPLSVL